MWQPVRLLVGQATRAVDIRDRISLWRDYEENQSVCTDAVTDWRNQVIPSRLLRLLAMDDDDDDDDDECDCGLANGVYAPKQWVQFCSRGV